MSGHFVIETDDYPHECHPPMMGPAGYKEPEAGLGSVWECECGRRFVVRMSLWDAPFGRWRVPAWKRLRRLEAWCLGLTERGEAS